MRRALVPRGPLDGAWRGALLVALLLLAVLVTAWWPAHLRRPLAAGGDRPWLPGDA